MKRFIAWSLGVFGIITFSVAMFIGPSTPPATSATLDPTLTEHMPPLIRKMGMRCQTLSAMKLQAKTERGDIFKAICDEATSYYQYRILYTPSGQMTIRPWSE